MNQNILIIGLSGNGKKSIKNSISYKMNFDRENHESLPTPKRKEDTAETNVFTLPKDGDISTASEQQIKDEIMSIFQNDGNSICFDAIVFVLKYGVRFTRQDKDAVEKTKKLFGENVFRDHTILAFSYGDNFEVEHKEGKLKFQEWCQQQRGEMQKLFQEVNYRCVLFNNTSTDETVKTSQVECLMRLISIKGEDVCLNDQKELESHLDSPDIKKKKSVKKNEKSKTSGKSVSTESGRLKDNEHIIVLLTKKYCIDDFSKAQRGWCVVS